MLSDHVNLLLIHSFPYSTFKDVLFFIFILTDESNKEEQGLIPISSRSLVGHVMSANPRWVLGMQGLEWGGEGKRPARY